MESRKRIQPSQRRESDLITANLREKTASRNSIMAQVSAFEASASGPAGRDENPDFPMKKGPMGPFGATWMTGKS
jgi:hypothetical protein